MLQTNVGERGGEEGCAEGEGEGRGKRESSNGDNIAKKRPKRATRP